MKGSTISFNVQPPSPQELGQYAITVSIPLLSQHRAVSHRAVGGMTATGEFTFYPNIYHPSPLLGTIRDNCTIAEHFSRLAQGLKPKLYLTARYLCKSSWSDSQIAVSVQAERAPGCGRDRRRQRQ